jgi:hypothetical protein
VHRFDASTAECLVFTFKEGLLSPIAHNLKIRVTAFEIEVNETTRAIIGRFDATSLRVVCAMDGDREDPAALSRDNQREIERNIVTDVLGARDHPEIRFVSTDVAERRDQYAVRGTLTLCGRERRIKFPVRRDGGYYVAEARIHQPDFGIRPYSAMLGTLRVQADVLVRVRVPAEQK